MIGPSLGIEGISMFTGLVEDVGTLFAAAVRGDGGRTMSIRPSRLDPGKLRAGDSVAIDGACLTVTTVAEHSFEVVAGHETLRRTTLGAAEVGVHLHLERALRMGDRLGGHMVSGHVDALAEIHARRDLGANLELELTAPPELLRYVVEKGSVALDGISLTVNRVTERSFSIALIPHTIQRTALASKPLGAKVNLEVDLIGKYVEKLLGGYRGQVAPE
jgi:riboflavin synthase